MPEKKFRHDKAVFLHGLPKNAGREAIYTFLQKFGWIRKLDLPVGNTTVNRGFAYVHFKQDWPKNKSAPSIYKKFVP